MPIEVDVSIEAPGWPQGLQERAAEAVRHAIEKGGVPVTGPVEVSVLLTDDNSQRALNRQWRGKDSATNVLSFPQNAPFAPLAGLIGDISLALETLTREAAAQDKDFQDHFTHLLVHGTLHLLGYDHQTEDEALVMEGLETDILSDLDVKDPYAEA